MQGAWASHRRAKLNLNAPESPGAQPLAEDVTPAAAQPAPLEPSPLRAEPDADPSPAAATNGKRKIRASKTAESSSKRSKTSSNGESKDHAPPKTRLSDLGGVDACVEKMLELVAMPICHPEVYLHTGVQPPRGVLLHGPPGCGKTLLAHAMAGVSNIFSNNQMCSLACRNSASHSLVYLRRRSFLGCLESPKRL